VRLLTRRGLSVLLVVLIAAGVLRVDWARLAEVVAGVWGALGITP
jgi:hypothetical protein